MLKFIVPVLLVTSLCAAVAQAQTPTAPVGTIKSGTAIVVFYSKQRAVIAGDSRVRLVREAQGGKIVSFRDDECKVSSPRKRFLFAASGIAGYDYLPGETGEPWSAEREASRIAATIANDASDMVAVFAKQWGEWMRDKFDTELAKNEAKILGELHSPLMSSAVFIGRNKSGGLSLYTAVLVCACNETPKRTILRVDKQEPTAGGLPVALLGLQAD